MKFQVNRPAIIVALFMFSSVVFLGCQSYTTGLQKTRTNVDETAVIATLQTVATAQRAYAISNGGDYGSFEQLTEGGFLDSRFASDTPEVRGYILTMATGDKEFRCNADPSNNADGKHFYIDSKSSLIRVNSTQPATASDPVYRP
jgi:competence protein ComGC